MENTTWIKLYRKFTEWEWYDDINTKVLFLHLVLKANYKENRWHGIKIKRGQLPTGRFKLAEETGLTQQQVRTSLNKLISTNEITKLSTPQYTVITINNYNRYQTVTNESTNNQPTINQQVTTLKEVKKERSISKDTATPVYGNKDLISLGTFLKNNYPKPLMGITDTRKLQNLKQVMSKRKNQDEWMDDNWKENVKKFMVMYLEETEETYLVNSVEKLKEKAKLWREYRGKLN